MKKQKSSSLKKKKSIKKKSSYHFFVIGTSLLIFLSFGLGSFFYLTHTTNIRTVDAAQTEQNPPFFCIGNQSCGDTITVTNLPTITQERTPYFTTNSAQVTKVQQKDQDKDSDQDIIEKKSTTKIATSSSQLSKCKRVTKRLSWYRRMLNFIFKLFCKYFGKYCKQIKTTTTTTTNCSKTNVTPTPSQSSTQITPTATITLATITNTPTPTIPRTTLTSVPTVTVTSTPIPTPTISLTPSETEKQTTVTEQAGTNWGGYAYQMKSGATSASIESTWNISTITCKSGLSSLSPWIGFGGLSSSDQNIAQLGMDLACNGSAAQYAAWTEAYPANSVYYDTDTVKPGDQITASITYNGNGSFATTMTDTTQGWTITTPMTYDSSYVPQSGEYILERLDQDQSGSTISNILGIPSFTPPTTFTNATYSFNNQTKQSLSTAPGLINMYLSNKSIKETSNSAINGNTFSISFVAQ